MDLETNELSLGKHTAQLLGAEGTGYTTGEPSHPKGPALLPVQRAWRVSAHLVKQFSKVPSACVTVKPS